MAIRHKVVLINAAPGVGKSWLAQKVVDWTLQFQDPTVRAGKRLGFADGIRRTVQAMFGLPDKMDDESWREFKSRQWELGPGGKGLDGVEQDGPFKTGRGVMTDIGQYGRELDPNMWINNAINHIIKKDSTIVKGFLWIIDDCGFPHEIQSIQAHRDIDSLTVYISDSYADVTDGDYRQFDNDSRFDLSRHCTIRAQDSDKALTQVKQAILNRGW